MKCFYHSADLDGHCSGAIVYLYGRINDQDVEMYGVDYSDKVSRDDIKTGDEICIVDFAFDYTKSKSVLRFFAPRFNPVSLGLNIANIKPR